ncbi:MAG: cephalosporin hydroxylase [Fuerstiella sp.]|nr:cephalosporin hydroxylase [Fuerstiella sp.]
MNNPITQFEEHVRQNVSELGKDDDLRRDAIRFVENSARKNYSYNFSSLGQPIIQYPQDMVAMQELIWTVRPDLIIETGIAHGGSLVMNAAMLTLLDYCDCVESGDVLNPAEPQRKVLGIDIDIREHNRAAVEAHPMSNRIEMLQGSSVADEIVRQVTERASGFECILVCLDSNHTHDHVLAELHAYAPLVTRSSYCIVFDTIIEDVPAEMFPDRQWGPGDNPKTAVHEFLKTHAEFEIDHDLDAKLLISVAPNGYLRRIA